ncbi:hypothetical protein BSL78_05497 [Apostichopus japonicus]|uniref:PLAT domain-containing protein n=1 Tax=Stichopus japonicus TaxID=307972 RepID=A0A2G8LBG7_STIJA|nr:hypothetical protein BSL78_05497 [Apostichopus japonicus]
MAIHTGSRLGASTTADIFVILFGEKGNTGKIKLKQSKEGDRMKFQKGQIDVFRVESFFVGRLECVCIGHERKELGCGWFCDKVLIREFDNNVTYEFVCSRWFSAQDDDGRTERTLPVTNVIMEVSSSSESEDDDKRYTSTSAVSDTDRHLSEATGIDNGQSNDYLSARSDGGSSSRASKRRSKKSRKGHTTTGSDSESGESDRRGRSRKKRGDDSSSSSSGTSDSESDSSSDDEPARRGKGRRSHSVNNNNNIRELSDDGIAERENYMIGFKAGLKAREDEIRRQEDERREEEEYMKEEEERLMLQGPSIHECCQTGDLTRVKKLINYSHDVIGTTDERGRTPLHVASSHGRLDLVKWLVMNDASVNELTQTGYSCMHLSSMNGHVQVMKILVALGVDVDCLTVDEQTPLHLAAMNGHIDCCKWLVANNATLDAKDVMGRPPLELADEYQHQDCAEFLRSCQSELNRSESSLSQIRSRSPSREREVRAGTASGREEEEIKTKQDSTSEMK